MAFPHATICVQGIKDGVDRHSIEAQFEVYGRIVRVDITPNSVLKGVADTRIAFVEFRRRDDARKAMQALNGRYVQGKCVMIKFARSAPGVRPPAPNRGMPEMIPQTPNHQLLAAKFGKPKEREQSRTRSPCRSHDRRQGSCSRQSSAARSPSRWRPPATPEPSPRRERRRDRSRERDGRRDRDRDRDRGRDGERQRDRGQER